MIYGQDLEAAMRHQMEREAVARRSRRPKNYTKDTRKFLMRNVCERSLNKYTVQFKFFSVNGEF